MKSRRKRLSARYLFYFCGAMEKKLSIVIPVYNRAGIVGRTLRSVEAQTYRPLKVILVDNGSTDGTSGVLQSWRRAVSAPDFEVVILTEPTPGAAAARNTGLRQVDTPWVMFFDSDDTMRPGHCLRAMTAATGDVDVVGWDVELFLPAGRRTGSFLHGHYHFDNVFHGGMATQRWCARADTVRKAGGWNPSALIWDDIELGSRMIESGARIKRLEGERTVDVEFSDVSISNEPWISRMDRMASVLELIKRTLPVEKKKYASFKLVLGAGEAKRLSPDPQVRAKADDMYRRAMSEVDTMKDRLLMRLVHNYICHFSHGAVAFLSLFLR